MKTISELSDALNKLGVSKNAYSLPGQCAENESYVLERDAMDRYAIYYYERGIQSGLKYFDTEELAVLEFYRMINKDSSVK